MALSEEKQHFEFQLLQIKQQKFQVEYLKIKQAYQLEIADLK